MKKEIHPDNYRPVVFKDVSNGEMFLVYSSIETEATAQYEGKEYPLYEVEVSSSSHPFYTGDQRIMDTAGRAERFRARVAKAAAKVSGSKKKTTPAAEVAA